MMRNLPVPVEEEEIEAMFEFADKDKDGKINYKILSRPNSILCLFVYVECSMSRGLDVKTSKTLKNINGSSFKTFDKQA